MRNVRLVDLLHDENTIVASKMRTYRKHFGNNVVGNKNNKNNNIKAWRQPIMNVQ